jgi:hypothetical protein
MKSLADRLRRPDVLSRQSREQAFVVHIEHIRHDGIVRELQGSCGRPCRFRSFEKWPGVRLQPRRRFVQIGGEQPELAVRDTKSLAPLMDAPLANDE